MDLVIILVLKINKAKKKKKIPLLSPLSFIVLYNSVVDCHFRVTTDFIANSANSLANYNRLSFHCNLWLESSGSYFVSCCIQLPPPVPPSDVQSPYFPTADLNIMFIYKNIMSILSSSRARPVRIQVEWGVRETSEEGDNPIAGGNQQSEADSQELSASAVTGEERSSRKWESRFTIDKLWNDCTQEIRGNKKTTR